MSSAPTIPSAEWERHKSRIRTFFLEGNKTHKELVKCMASTHGFFATEKQYVRKLGQWNMRKNLKAKDCQDVSRIVQARRRSGKASTVLFQGKMVSKEQFQKKVGSYLCSSSYLSTLLDNVSVKPPEGFFVGTPRTKDPVRLTFTTLPCFQFQDSLQTLMSTSPERVALSIQAEDVDRLCKSLCIVDGTQDKLIQLPSDFDASMPSRHTNTPSQLEMHGQANFFARFLQYAVYLGSNNLLDRGQTENLVEAIIATQNIPLLEQILQGQGPTARMFATGLLVSAIKLKNYKLSHILLRNGANPNAIFQYSKKTVLGLAIETSDPAMVKLLVDFGADPNLLLVEDYLPRSPLGCATRCTKETSASIIQILLDAKADANGSYMYTEHDLDPPLFQAVEAKNAAAARLLIAAGASVNQAHENGPALALAIEQADVPMIQLLLEAKADVNMSWRDRNNVLRTPIQVAASLALDNGSTSLEIAHILLSAGANVNPHDSRHGAQTPVQIACQQGNLDMARLLLDRGANINPIAHTGHTPLQAAIMSNHQHVIDLLLERGADINPRASFCGGRTALQAAAERGNLDLVWRLLMRGGDIHGEAAESEGLTTLQAAASSGNLGLVEYLLQFGARVNHPISRGGTTELQAAVKGGNVDIVRRLLLAGADVHAEAHTQSLLTLALRHKHMDVFEALLPVTDLNFPAHQTSTPLFLAVGKRLILTVDRLLMAGADVNAISCIAWQNWYPGLYCKATPLVAAARVGNVSMISTLVKAGAAINRSLPGTLLPLHEAVRQQSINTIQLLLSHEADPNQIEPRTGYRPLHEAMSAPRWYGYGSGGTCPDIPVVQVLLDGGADVNALGIGGETPLSRALEAKDIESLLPVMIRAGANVNARSNGIPPIHVLGTRDLGPDVEEKLIRMLIDAGADINSSSNGHATALQNAIKNRNSNVVRLLLDKNADVNAPSARDRGRTALQAAAENGDLPLVKELLTRGADINASPRHNGGATALQLAAIKGHFSVAVFLAENGADINTPEALIYGRTALEGAAEHGRLDMVHFLLENDNDDETIEERCQDAAWFAEDEGHHIIAEILRAWKKL